MNSSHYGLKSLKNTLLEFVVLNFEFVFNGQESSPVPIFPIYIFDEILEKSKDMCWPLNKEHLIPCIAVRDRLKWSENNCFRFANDLNENDVKLFENNTHAIETLGVIVRKNYPKDVYIFKKISKAANTLQDLDLAINTFCDNLTHSVTYLDKIKKEAGPCKSLKLKRLVLRLRWFEYFPYNLDFEKMVEFDLNVCNLNKFVLKALIGFKRLIHLSLRSLRLKDISMEDVIEAVLSLKNLRVLHLLVSKQTINGLMLNKILNEMDNLDVLELGDLNVSDSNSLLTTRKKLKVLNYGLHRIGLNTSGDTESDLNVIAYRIGHFYNVNGIMSVISTTPKRCTDSLAVYFLFQLKMVDYKMLTDYENQGIFNFRSPLRLAKPLPAENYGSTSYDTLLRMTCYGVKNFSPNWFSFLHEWLQIFVGRYKNTHLANRFTKLLHVYSK